MKKLLTVITALLAFASVSAQTDVQTEKKKTRTAYLHGPIYDSFTKAAIDAKIVLMKTDSTIVDSTRITRSKKEDFRIRDNFFTLKVPLQREKYILLITADGYEDQTVNYELRPVRNKQAFVIPEILMKRAIHRTVDLDGVEVVGTRVQMTYRGDTIVYDAAAFNLPEGSMLDGLIRQMPGAELKDNGDIYINGKKIDYLTLNGEDFFKGKNLVMLENLPYYTVKNVKVYNKSTERSEMLGKDIEKRDYVMDVSLKREYAKGTLANAEVGMGTEDRWMARLFGLRYTDLTRIAVFSNLNNVNETRKPGNDGEWSPKKMERELQTTRQAGLHMETKNKKRNMTEKLDFTLEWSDRHSNTRDIKETFADAGNIVSKKSSLRSTDEFDMHFSNTFYVKWLHSHITADYTQGSRTWANRDSTYRNAPVNNNLDNGLTKYKRLNAFGVLSYNNVFETGDIFSIQYSPRITINKPDKGYKLEQTYYNATDKTDLRNRYTDTQHKSFNHAFNTSYMFQLPNFWRIGPVLHYTYTHEETSSARYNLEMLDAEKRDELGWLPSTRDSLLAATDHANSYDQKRYEHAIRGGIQIERSWNNGIFVASLPLRWNKERTLYQRAEIDTAVTRRYTHFTPNIFLYTYGKNRYEFNYNVNSSVPTVAQLLPFSDTSNPLAVHINNPDLKTRTNHRLSGKIDIRCDSLNMNYYLQMSATITDNAFGVRTSYNTQTGAYTYMNDNVDGNWEGSLQGGINGTLGKKRRWNYGLYIAGAYKHSVDFGVAYDDSPSELSKVNTFSTGAGATLGYRLQKLTIGMTAKLQTRHSRSDYQDFENINAYDYQYGLNIKYTVPVLKLDVATDITNFSRRGYGSDMMNTDDIVWNAQLARSFMKGLLTAKVTAFDILHQLSTVRYNINAQGRTETWYRSIPRYVMFSLAYKFSKKPKK